VTEPLGFHHAALQVRDVEKVASFYRELMGLAELRRFHHDDGSLRSVWLSLAPGFLAVEQLPDGAAAPAPSLGYSMLALRIDPARRASISQWLEARGVAVVEQTAWTLYVRDPEGNLVGLSHHPFDAPA
jgi:catechol 2,3-dioxygenase-like lactoylglutathione lyase family enzyme